MENQNTIAEQITNLKRELAALEAQRDVLKNKIAQLQNSLAADTKIADPTVAYGDHQVTGESSEAEKITLFRSLFRGREDVFPKRFESKRTGKSGYQPVCNNEWIRPICKKTKNIMWGVQESGFSTHKCIAAIIFERHFYKMQLG